MTYPKRQPLLDLDAALAASLTPVERAEIRGSLSVPVISVPRGVWEPALIPSRGAELGFLVVEGQLVRQVTVGDGISQELIGEGDLLRPWQDDASSFCRSSWKAITQARLAALDARFVAAASRWPSILIAIVDRSLRRSRFMAAQAAVSNQVGVERRLLDLFWQLAERWGRLEDGEVVVKVGLTHQLLADVISARRPSVTDALRRLVVEGAVERLPDGSWLLREKPASSA